MEKKMLVSAIIILLAGLVGRSEGVWCDDGLQCTPEQELDLCDPGVWPDGNVPSGPVQVELPCDWTCMKIGCDLNIEQACEEGSQCAPSIRGPGGFCDQTLRVYSGTLNIHNRWYVAHSGIGKGTLILEGDTVVNSLTGSSYCFRCGDAGGQPRVILRDNAALNVNGGWRNGDSSGGWACLWFGGNCTVNVNEYIRIGDVGVGEMHFEGGHITVDPGSISQNGRGGDYGDMTISGTVEIYCGGGFSLIWTNGTARCYMSGGTVNARNFDVHGGGDSGTGILYMTGGLIIARDSFNAPRTGNGAIAEVQLDGGEIQCGSLTIAAGGTMNITGGRVVLDGDQLQEVYDLVCVHGRLTGYGYSARVVYVYDPNTDKTIVTADPGIDPKAAYCPNPLDDASVCVAEPNVGLRWKGTRGIRDKHAVYFSSDVNCVANLGTECLLGYFPASWPAKVLIPRENLDWWTTYYWRVVEYYFAGPTVEGPIWSFTLVTSVADLDRDCGVAFKDYSIMAGQWLQPPGVPPADIAPPGGDGVVDEFDLDVLTEAWLAGLGEKPLF
ncbi:MAG: hypothetical protein ACYTEQ_17540 [Planctomycetota bacterium]